MKKNVVRVLALVLVALMCLSLVPLAAHAEAHVHEMAEDHQDPTCVDNGFNQTYCPICGATFSMDYIPATGVHSFMNVVDEQYLIHEGDCEHAFQYWKSCSVCQQSAEEAYANALDAMYEELNNRKNSGEQADWEQVVKDRVLLLDEKYKFSYGGEGHHYIHVDHQEATCTSDGWKEYSYCDVCGEYFNYEVIPAKGHRWGEYTQTKAPTCTEAGEKVRVCEVCDEKDVVVLPALGHAWGEFKVTKEATCTEDGSRERVCSVCKEKEVQVIPAAHKFGEYVVTLEPTCFVDGSRERTCTVCGHKEVEAIPAAHTYGEFTVTQEPTCYSTGAKTAKCTVCGHEHTEWIDKVPHKYENGECVFCHEAMPEGYVAPSDDRTEITETAGSEPETTDNQATEPETADNQTAEPETLGTANENTEPEQQNAEPAAESAPVNTVTITFDGNGATGGSMEPQAFAEGSVQALSANAFTRDGYLFLGWDVAADGSAMGEDRFLDGEAVEVNSDVTLYAQWKPVSDETETQQVETQQTEASAETVSDYMKAIGRKKTSETNPDNMVARNVTPLREDGSRMSNEEVAALGGVTFEMPLPENYKPGDSIEIHHQNSETGEWELITDYVIEGDKVIIKLDHFSPVVIEKTGPFTVTFDGNGGSFQSGAFNADEWKNKEKGTVQNLPNIGSILRPGHTLLGWSKNKTGIVVTYAPGASYTFYDDEILYAKWDIRVSYLPNGSDVTGGPMQSTPVTSENVQLSNNAYQRDGYAFNGWNTAADGSGTSYADGQSITAPSDDLDLYAQWAKKKITISFDANGGTGTMTPMTDQDWDQEITLTAKPDDFKYDENTFLGWNTKDDGTGDHYDDKATIEGKTFTKDTVLYAEWSKSIYTVTYNINTGDGGGPMAKQTIDTKTQTSLTLRPNTFTKTDFTFTGWNTKANGEGTSYTDKQVIPATDFANTGSLVLWAQWKPNVVTVKFDANRGSGSGDGSMPDKEVNTTTENPYTLPKNTYTNTGYVFNGWNTKGDGKGESVADEGKLTIPEDYSSDTLTLYAQWITAIRFDANGGTGTMTPQNIKLNEKTTIKANTFTRTNYTFDRWTEDKEGSDPSYADQGDITPTTSLTLYAQWIKTSYAVNYDKNGGGGTAMTSDSVKKGEEGTVKANTYTAPTTSLIFGGWKNQADNKIYQPGDSIESDDVPTDITLVAQWAEPITITFEPGDGSGENETQTVAKGIESDLIPVDELGFTAPANHVFDKWLVKDSNPEKTYEDGERVTFAADTTLVAQWEEQVFTISFDRNGGSGTTDPVEVHKVQDSSVTLTENGFTKVIPGTYGKAHYAFTGWNTKADGTGTDYENRQTIPSKNITEDLKLYAQWAEAIVFDKNNDKATGTMVPQDITRNEETTLKANGFSLANYSFDKWTTEKNGTGTSYADQATLTPDTGMTLYAQWVRSSYAVNYDKNGGGGTTMTPGSYEKDKQDTVKENTYNAPDSSKIFGEWNTKADGNGDSYAPGDKVPETIDIANLKDITLYAIWQPKLEVWFNPGDGSGSAVKQDEPKDSEVDLPDPKDFSFTAPAGQTFKGWQVGTDTKTYKAGDSYTFTEPVTVKAIWADSIKISYDPNGGTLRTDAGTFNTARSWTIPKDTAYTLYTADQLHLTRDGYQFEGWMSTASGSTIKYTDGQTIDEGFSQNTTIYAKWKRVKIADTVTISGSTTGSDPNAIWGETLTATVVDPVLKTGFIYTWKVGDEEVQTGESNTLEVKPEYYGKEITCTVTHPQAENEVVSNIKTVGVYAVEEDGELRIVNSRAKYPGLYYEVPLIFGAMPGTTYYKDGKAATVPESAASGAFEITEPGVYVFGDTTYVATQWWTIGYSSSNGSGDNSGSGTTTMKRGSTTLSGTTRIKSGDVTLLEPFKTINGYNSVWLVRDGSGITDITLTARPSSGSYGHVSRNGSGFNSSNAEQTISLGTIDEPELYEVIYNKSSSSPRTGDMSNLGLWSALCLVSFVGVTTILTSARKRKNRG